MALYRVAEPIPSKTPTSWPGIRGSARLNWWKPWRLPKSSFSCFPRNLGLLQLYPEVSESSHLPSHEAGRPNAFAWSFFHAGLTWKSAAWLMHPKLPALPGMKTRGGNHFERGSNLETPPSSEGWSISKNRARLLKEDLICHDSASSSERECFYLTTSSGGSNSVPMYRQMPAHTGSADRAQSAKKMLSKIYPNQNHTIGFPHCQVHLLPVSGKGIRQLH